MKKIDVELKEVRQRFASLEKMAEALRPHPGFEGLNAATLSRWMNKKPPRRAAMAIQVLKSKVPSMRLRIAEPRSLWVLPSTMLGWKADAGRPYSLLKTKYGIDVEIATTETGNGALQLLQEEKVEIALAAPELLNQCGPDCCQISSLSKARLIGIMKEKVGSVSDLKGLRLGVPEGSAIPMRLGNLCNQFAVAPPHMQGFKKVSDFVRAIKKDKKSGGIDGVVGWEPLISQIKSKIPDLLTVRPDLLGSIEIVAVVNMTIAEPAAIRAYLSSLQETSEYVEKRKSIPAFHAEVAGELGMDKQDVKNVLENSVFFTSDSDLATLRPLLSLWEREVAHKQ